MPRLQKCVSGNPKGRPRSEHTPVTARQMMLKARAAGPEAIEWLIKEMKTAERSSERLTAAGVLLDRAYGRPMQAIDVAVIRQDLKKHLAEIVMGSPSAMEKLAALKSRLDQLEEFDPHRVIEAIAAPVDGGAYPDGHSHGRD
jgi:hypothetical protein